MKEGCIKVWLVWSGPLHVLWVRLLWAFYVQPLSISLDDAAQGGAFSSREDWTWRGLFCKMLVNYSLHCLNWNCRFKSPSHQYCICCLSFLLESQGSRKWSIPEVGKDWLDVCGKIHASWPKAYEASSGNIIIVASATSVLLGLTWGGVRSPWSSVSVLLPLILGLVGVIAFVVYEAFMPVEPTMPIRLLKNRTSISGQVKNFYPLFNQ